MEGAAAGAVRAMTPFDHVVGSEDELRRLIGTPAARSVLKERRELDHHDRAFIALSPLVLLATAGAGGCCDVSPKGDAPGFVQVLDAKRLVIPDRRGNKRLDGMLNLLVNPHVGLIFLIPGREETLRVNGRAWVTRDPALLEPCTVEGSAPLVAIGVAVEQVFVHCPKAFLRSRFWGHESWPTPDALPSMGCVLYDQIKPEGVTVQEYEREIAEGQKRLY